MIQINKEQIEILTKVVKLEGKELMDVYSKLVRGGEVEFEMKDDVDLVTALDIKVENELKRIVKELFPTHSIVGEESEKESNDDNYTWYIDPIDGTKYFKAGMTMFTMSLGLRYKGKNVFGIVYNPAGDDIMVGGEGIGAFRNGEKLEKLTPKPLNKSMYYVDIPGIHKLSEEEKMIGLNFTNKVMLETYRVRMYGASVFAAFGCATGFLSGTLDVYGKQKDVDMCAYSAILQQVGYEEKKIKIGDKENIWLVLPENFEELKKLV